jgi:hypothetical protein
VIAVTGISLSLSLAFAPWVALFLHRAIVFVDGQPWISTGWDWLLVPVISLSGVLLLFAVLHLARGIGHVHGQVAKHLLVRGERTP